jgi:hypothetical protein
VFIATKVLTHPGTTVNIQERRERARALGLVDSRLERLPVDLEVLDISRVESHRLTSQPQCALRPGDGRHGQEAASRCQDKRPSADHSIT